MLIRGVQLADAPNGISTTKINDGAVTSAKVDGSVLSTNTLNAAPANDYTALGKKIISVADGTAATDAVNLSQLQAVSQGMAWKASCETGTTAALPNAPVFAGAPGGPGGTLTSSANAVLVVGGVNVTKLGQRVLVAGQANAQENGIYELTQAGSAGPVPPAAPWILTRTNDMDVNAEVPRAATTIDNTASSAFGLIYVVSNPLYPLPGGWQLNVDPITFSTIPLPAALVAGSGISIAGLTISVDIDATPVAPPAGRGLTFNGNKLAADIEPNRGMKFDDLTGRFTNYVEANANVQGGIEFGANGGLAAKLEASQGLSIGPNSGIQVKLEASTPTGGGLQIGPNGGIEAKLDANSAGLKYTALGIQVKTKTAVAIDSTGGLAINGSGEVIAQVNSASGGLQINASNEIEAKIEPSTPTNGGLQISGTGGIEAKLNASGGLDYTATGLTVKLGNPANDSTGLTLSAAGLYVSVNNRKQISAAAASAGAGTAISGTALAATPFRANGGNGIVTLMINGVEYEVADGGAVANAVTYFSGDGGVTVRAWSAIQAGDLPYRGGGLPFDTIVTDRIILTYLA